MLIEAPYKNGDTVSVKTVAGEEIVARLVDENGETLTVTKPMALTATQQGIGMVPFSFTVSPDSKLSLNKNTLVFIAKTDESTAKQYIESTTNIKL
jgi:hypothetical protein